MKCKVTKKQIKNNYCKIIGIGYCNSQSLLGYHNSAFAYSAGIYGWKCDYYQVDNICISTGYDYINGVKYDYSILRKYEAKAKLINSSNLDYDKKKSKVQKLLDKFIAEATK